jgi:EAL domain-containing protein (putative c-di-GMP-specific phosphodiesterase class I)
MHRSGVAMELSREGSATAEEVGTPISERAVSRRIAIESALERAIDDRELHVVYQPQVRSNGQLLGFEALVRWNSPALGAVSPAEFVPVAEQMGCVSRITDYILDEVCRQLALWMAAGAQAPRVAVNLSARDLDRDNLFETVLAAVGRYDVPVGALDLEVTETFLAERPERALAQLKLLREWSFKISIDDFGTGYSSLSKLADLPIDVLKIDRSFLLDLPGNARRERIVRSIVTLANNLHLQVVAEGVERGAQLRFLQMLGVDAYQGFLFHAPAPAEHWTPMLLGGLPTIEDLMLPGAPQFGHSLI